LMSPSTAKVVSVDTGLPRAREYNDFIINWGGSLLEKVCR
jgi:hypothetical protein